MMQKIRQLLVQYGMMRAEDLCHFLGVSQPKFSRLVAQFGGQVLVVGRARATRYALKKQIFGQYNQIPIYEVNEKGSVRHWGDLFPLEPKGYYFKSCVEDLLSVVYEDLPYFLDDLRPAGFLGRLIPKKYPTLGFPDDISHWTADQCLFFWMHHGWDLIGNLIVGETACRLFMQKQNVLVGPDSSGRQISVYDELAKDVLGNVDVGSSAAGEQPKFLTRRKKNQRPVLVKFTPLLSSGNVSVRYADLLVCEHIAHKILAKSGVPAVQSILLRGQNRLYLECERFDRNDLWGRSGVISLQALDAQFVGNGNSWTRIAGELKKLNLISHKIEQQIRWLDLFGQFIGNTDRHAGNLSFLTRNLKIISLAPIYDMLPMCYAPVHNQFSDKALPLIPLLPEELELAQTALKAALLFWETVSAHKQISRQFALLAKKNSKIIQLSLTPGK